MMTLRIVHAGAGYTYLLRSVATNDAQDESAKDGKLSAYYHAKGTPPGQWIGSGLQGFSGLGEAISEKDEVTGDQMAALYGLGIHPNAYAEMSNGVAYRDLKLGREFRVYAGKDPILQKIERAEKHFKQMRGRVPTIKEKNAIIVQNAREEFEKETGYSNPTNEQIIDWVAKKQGEIHQAVAAFDFTFSPVKSVSAIWALADEETANKIAQCHHRAVEHALSYFENEVLHTRSGKDGVFQIKTRGMIGAKFTHFDTRLGDPDLHSHVLVSNKVQAKDGRWLAIDSKPVHKYHQVISAKYDAAIQAELTRELGLEFTQIYRDAEKKPVVEVAGVPAELIDLFSQRRQTAQPIFEQKVAEYRQKYGKQPDRIAQKQLWQAAILETRDPKRGAKSLADLRLDWARQAAHLPVDEILKNVLSGNQSSLLDPLNMDDVEQAAAEILAEVSAQRSSFSLHNLRCATAVWCKNRRATDHSLLAQFQQKAEEILLENYLVPIQAPDVLDVPEALKPAQKKHLGQEKYTTRAILDAEQTVLDAMDETVATVTLSETIDSVLAQHEKENGWALNSGQQQMARHLLQSGALVSVAVGPAGTGKTTSMQIVAKAVEREGHRVIGLAPSAKAAELLADEIGAEATTIDKLTFTWNGKNPYKQGKTVADLPVEINPGDVLLVDEAGMASAENLAALVEIARATGAVLRCIGDPNQLAAVQHGGLFKTMVEHCPTVTLTEVMRFNKGKDTAQAEASLLIREGNTDAVAYYKGQEWIKGGSHDEMLQQAVDAYLADIESGKKSLVIAATNKDVDLLNQMIRQAKIISGEVDQSKKITVKRGDCLAIGDTIITRQNQKFTAGEGKNKTVTGKVTNGQMFTVADITTAGDLVVIDHRSGNKMVLPADYAYEHTHLGYASTVYRAQGATVDTCHSIIDSAVNRQGLYVAMTRGRYENRAYCVTSSDRVDVDFEAETFHATAAVEDKEITAEDVFARAIKKDGAEKSATEQIRQEFKIATSVETKRSLYEAGLEIAYKEFADKFLQELADTLPKNVAEELLESDSSSLYRQGIYQVFAADQDPRALDWSWLEDDQKRREYLQKVAKNVKATAEIDLKTPPPLWSKTDVELTLWLTAQYDSLRQQPAPTAQPDTASAARVADLQLASNRTYSSQSFSEIAVANTALDNVTFDNCTIDLARFNALEFKNCTFLDCKIDQATFEHCTFESTSFINSSFTDCTINSSVFANSDDVFANQVRNTDFDSTNINATLERVDFVDCSFTCCQISGQADVTGWSNVSFSDTSVTIDFDPLTTSCTNVTGSDQAAALTSLNYKAPAQEVIDDTYVSQGLFDNEESNEWWL